MYVFVDECARMCVLWECIRVFMGMCAFVCVIDEDRLRKNNGKR